MYLPIIITCVTHTYTVKTKINYNGMKLFCENTLALCLHASVGFSGSESHASSQHHITKNV